MKSILIIDYSRTSRIAVRKSFNGHDLTWHEAKNGDDTFGILETFTIDLVICNAVLGRADGLETLSK
ncbi:response regulator [Pseudochryseolinea flava]|uniref:Response regulatory domain-containing protein n=1 Tax=Pseudochryseolinea flava TaxID=2059302 RepID=A0A364Y5C3_9BACT|nr:response regulator [Pseudochryseolinea flava]RAW02005.1 hypothetical protein DQQ10_05460 [Pseudochryseolinea flava]